MEKRGLIIGIDYTGEYCQASCYSRRHGRPESMAFGKDARRYLIPVAISYNEAEKDWLIGQSAIDYAREQGDYLFQDLLENVFIGEKCTAGGQEYTYTQLFAIFIAKIIEYTQTATSIMGVENITMNFRRVTPEIRVAMDEVFRMLRIPAEKVKLVTCAESFAYYVLGEDPAIWEKGVLLFDFGRDGFYEKILTVTGNKPSSPVYISERMHSGEFSMENLGNEVLMDQMDERLSALFAEIAADTRISSVYFTGEGFQNMWFKKTLALVSESKRAFKGNNLYAKGACRCGLIKAAAGGRDYRIICAGRTRCTISAEAVDRGEKKLIELSVAPKDWFEAGCRREFILDEPGRIRLHITSLIEKQTGIADIDLSAFPKRPAKATRVELAIEFKNEYECTVSVKDLGFGGFFEPSGAVVSEKLDLKGYI